MVKWNYVIGGITCFLVAILVYSVPASAITENSTDNVSLVNGTDISLVGGNTDVKIVSSFSGNPIRPALMESTNIIYNDVDFYLYSVEPVEYSIFIYENSFDDPEVFTGDVDFVELQNIIFSEDTKTIKKIVIVIGSDKYEFENVKIMHQAIDEDQVYELEEDSVTKQSAWIKQIQSFVAGVAAAIVFAFGFYIVWKRHKENNVVEFV